MWCKGDRVTVAVSGGMDSMCLLAILFKTQRAHGGLLQVVSVDHGLREDAADDLDFVSKRASDYGLPFFGRKLALQQGGNLQARARVARREALLAIETSTVATAHHMTDQAETILYRLLRGSGARGLRGMLPVSQPWCRPLLGVSRDQILKWAIAEGVDWREDPSNPASLRGKLRSLMPVLDEFHGDAARALARSGRLLARDDAFLHRLTEENWGRIWNGDGLDFGELRALPEALQLRLLRLLLEHENIPVRGERLEAFLLWNPREGGSLSLVGARALFFLNGYIVIK